MRNWPTWIPNLNAWLNAILLIILARVYVFFVQIIFQYILPWLPFPSKGLLFAYAFTLLLPIALIAFLHQWLHLLFDQFFPNTRPSEIDQPVGFFPGIMSWWEGLYGWQTLIISYLVSSVLWLIFLPLSHEQYLLTQWWGCILKELLSFSGLIQVVIMAYLYQFEALVRSHLISLNSSRS